VCCANGCVLLAYCISLSRQPNYSDRVLRPNRLFVSLMFAAATSFFSRSNISQNYTIGGPSTGSRTATPAPGTGTTTSFALPTPANVPPFQVGPWRVQSATHKVTGKRVSVWTFDKRSTEIDRLSPMARDKSMDVLKAEVRCIHTDTHGEYR